MMTMRRSLLFLLVLLPIGLTGCISIPEPLDGDIDQVPLPEAVGDVQIGRTLLWGGTLVVARPGEAATCLEILARTLDSQRRPKTGDLAHGRFRACHSAFLDPEIFTAGREVTVVGELVGFEIDAVGEFDYRFPVLETESVHLWPERVPFDGYYNSYYNGFHNPYWRFYGWPYGRPYWIHRGPRHLPGPARPHSAPAAPRQPAAPAR